MKKFIALFLVVSFMGMYCATYEKGKGINLEPGQKPGAKLVIQKKDGQQVKGELIAVKENSLLLKESETGADVSVDFKNVSVITIVKKSKFLLGAGIGALSAVGGAFLLGSDDEEGSGDGLTFSQGLILVSIIAVAGALLGGLIGNEFGKDKTIYLEGKSDSEIKQTLEDLRKKARVPDFQ